jgi:hypothetical protein
VAQREVLGVELLILWAVTAVLGVGGAVWCHRHGVFAHRPDKTVEIWKHDKGPPG